MSGVSGHPRRFGFWDRTGSSSSGHASPGRVCRLRVWRLRVWPTKGDTSGCSVTEDFNFPTVLGRQGEDSYTSSFSFSNLVCFGCKGRRNEVKWFGSLLCLQEVGHLLICSGSRRHGPRSESLLFVATLSVSVRHSGFTWRYSVSTV